MREYEPTHEDHADLEHLRRQMAVEESRRTEAVSAIRHHFANRLPAHHRVDFTVEQADELIDRALGLLPATPGSGPRHCWNLLANAGVAVETLRVAP